MTATALSRAKIGCLSWGYRTWLSADRARSGTIEATRRVGRGARTRRQCYCRKDLSHHDAKVASDLQATFDQQ